MANTQDSPPHTDTFSASFAPSLLQIFWSRKALIILGAVVGLTIGALYFAQRKPVYQSSARVHVVKKTPEVTAGFESYGAMEDYLQTHKEIITSPKLVALAVKEGQLDTLHSFQDLHDQNTVVAIICGSLKVNRETAQTNGTAGPSILNLSYQGPDPDDCKTILSTVIATFIRYLDDSYRSTSKDTVEQLAKMDEQLKKQRDDKQKELNDLRKNGPTLIGRDGTTVNDERLATLRTRLSNLVIRRTELESQLKSIEKELKEGRDPSILINSDLMRATQLQTATPGSAAMSDAVLEEKLAPFRVEEQEMLNRLGPSHPDVLTIRNRIQAMREVWRGTMGADKSRSPARGGQARALLDANVGSVGLLATPLNQGPWVVAAMAFSGRSTTPEVTLYVLNLQAQLTEACVIEKALEELEKKEADTIRDMTGFREQESSLRDDVARAKEFLDLVKKKVLEASAVRETGGYRANVIAEPSQGGQIEPKPAPIFTVALLLGLGVGIALAWVAEATDKSFRTPDEVRRRLGLAVVGHMPRIAPEPEAVRQHEAGTLPLDPSICAFYQSKSLEAEAFRGIRTTLYFSAQNEGCKIIQVTSPNMGDGKTTLATNLAVSIAQSGKKILLIDADFRRPRLHRMFGLRAKCGLATVIQHDTELSDAIQPTVVPNLSILPCGPRPSNPAELLTSPRFKEVLETLRDKFDIILVDTPPLLAVSDPSVVASQVDGVLITIRVSKNGRPAAERARDILATLEANVLGVIVNGIGNRGQEGYGASHYGYQYQYQYAYEPTDNRSYYQDGEQDSQVHKNGVTSPHGLGVPVPDDEPIDPDAVDIGAQPVRHERPRERVPTSRRKSGDQAGAMAGLAKWLRSTLWH